MPQITELYKILKQRVYSYQIKYPLECKNFLCSIEMVETLSATGFDKLVMILTCEWTICIRFDHFDNNIYLDFIKSNTFISRYSLSYSTFYYVVIVYQKPLIEFSWFRNGTILAEIFPSIELLNVLKNILKVTYSTKNDSFKMVNPFRKGQKS